MQELSLHCLNTCVHLALVQRDLEAVSDFSSLFKTSRASSKP